MQTGYDVTFVPLGHTTHVGATAAAGLPIFTATLLPTEPFVCPVRTKPSNTVETTISVKAAKVKVMEIVVNITIPLPRGVAMHISMNHHQIGPFLRRSITQKPVAKLVGD